MQLSSREIEIFLARLYTDSELLAHFVADPVAEMHTQNLSDNTMSEMRDMDIQGLIMASSSYSHKRQQYPNRNILIRIYKKILAIKR
jgi:hypothetical protein